MHSFFHSCHDHLNDHNENIVRKVVFACRTRAVDRQDYDALLSGAHRIIEETGRQVTLSDYGIFHAGKGPYGNPEWYEQQALTTKSRGLGEQVSACKLDKLLRSEPYQQQHPHFDIFVLNRDLTTTQEDTTNNFIFGYGPYPNNIISTTRFVLWMPHARERRAALQIIGAHEFGHTLDLVHRNFNTGREGYQLGHCAGEKGSCLMEQVNVPGCKSMQEQARLLAGRKNLLCEDCTDEVRWKREDLRKKGVYW